MTGSEDNTSLVVACLGASITEAKGSFDWIDELTHRPENARFRLHNLGVGGDLAYSALRRLSRVVALRPDLVVVAVGWNDILTSVFPNARRFIGAWKRLPADPSPTWYGVNLRTIVRELHARTRARVGLVSPSEMGENPLSSNPVQRELNELFAGYRDIVEQTANDEGADYLPFYERLHEQIVAEPGQDFTALRFRAMYGNAFRQYLLRQSLDEIARRNGWRFHVDGLHLNRRGGMILTDVVQQFLAT
jgi:lysophospholipase L1-like esterase